MSALFMCYHFYSVLSCLSQGARAHTHNHVIIRKWVERHITDTQTVFCQTPFCVDAAAGVKVSPEAG